MAGRRRNAERPSVEGLPRSPPRRWPSTGKLHESEEKYRTLFDAIDEGFCIIEVLFDGNDQPIDYRFLEVNTTFENQTGIHDAQGRRRHEIAPLHEEHWFEMYGKIAPTGEPACFEHPAAQLHRWYEVYAYRVGEPQERTVAILFNDITWRKHAEEQLRASERRFRQLAEAIPHHVWSFRSDSSEGSWNQRLVNYTGLTTDALQQGGWAALHPDDLERVKAAWQEARAHGTEYHMEQRMRGRDGRYRRFLCRAVPVLDERRQPIEWFGTNTDIEDRRQAEDALFKAQAELAQHTTPQKTWLDLNDVIREVVTLVHHEVETHRILFHTDLAAALPLVRGERVQVQQVLLNLIMNGIEAMRAVTERPRELRIHAQWDEADVVQVVVQDCGVGFDPAQRARLFDPERWRQSSPTPSPTPQRRKSSCRIFPGQRGRDGCSPVSGAGFSDS